MKQHTLIGFTLIEILVSMALVGMVLMLGLYTYQTFVSFHLQYDHRLGMNSELSLLKYQMEKDISLTTKVSYQDGSTLYMWDRQGNSIAAYQETSAGIIRTSELRQDTFKLAGRWIEHPSFGLMLSDTAGLWQIPIHIWQESKVDVSRPPEQFAPSVDISFASGTNLIKG